MCYALCEKTMNKKTLAVIIFLAVVISSVVFLNLGKTKIKSYYAGDAIEYNGQLVITSANTGFLELFKFQAGQLTNVVKLPALVDGQVQSNTYNDALFNIEDERLYVYASSGSTLYKYDFSDLANLYLVKSSRDTTWDWLGHLTKVNNQIATAGSKAVKVWNYDLQVVDSYRLSNATYPYNIRLDERGRFIFNIRDSVLEVFDRNFRSITRTIVLANNAAGGNKQLYFDAPANLLYVLDDASLKKFGVDGRLYKSLRHDSQFGYDVVAARDENYIYIANGTSVAKLDKHNLKFVNAFENRDLPIPNSWAMGLKNVPTRRGEVVVVFNNSNILVLDKNLRRFASIPAVEEDKSVAATGALFLKTNTSGGPVGSAVRVSGGGFGANEAISLSFANTEYTAQSDANGLFSAEVVVPDSAKKLSATDIKAVGKSSGLHYSLGFYINR